MEENSPADPPEVVNPSVDWRSQIQPDARQRIINQIMDTLKLHVPNCVPEGLSELMKIAVQFEEKMYTAATDESDYCRKISLKMLAMESMFQDNNPPLPHPGNQFQDNNPPLPHPGDGYESPAESSIE